MSSTVIKETETENFSLRLSESYIDETQEKNQLNNIVISDSSSTESIFSCNQTNNFKHSMKIQNQLQMGINRNKFVIEKSNPENEQTKVSRTVEESVVQHISLSEDKKKEILQWLSNNFDGFMCETSYSQESIISKSRKSDTSSGNSSLERLELNFETPNNRGKFAKSKKTIKKNSTKQNTLDQYFIKLNEGPLNIINDSIVMNTNSDKIPISNIKINSRKLVVPECNPLVSNVSLDNSYNQISISKIKPNLNTIINCTINDYADILENLYGKTWKNKASTLISSTKPKQEQRTKILKDLQTEKNIILRQSRYNNKFDDYLSNNENENYIKTSIQYSETSKKSINKELKDSCINDGSIIECSLNCSYHTALSNSIVAQNKQLKIINPLTIEGNDKNKTTLSVCDSNFDLDVRNWESRNNQRKLSFHSTSSSTSEFDPEERVLPKLIVKHTRIKDLSSSLSIKPKLIKQLDEQDTKKSFLASLSKNVPHENADCKAMIYRIKYNIMKEELCKDLYKLFNEQVFDNKLPNDMLIEWSTRLRGTAGKCYNKQSLKTSKKTVRSSRIVLATKILDSPDRLRDTLIHEMCHTATWLINNVSDGHGSFWKAWATKATKVFPELPPISRCHNYEIQTKYMYKCINCGYSIGRHSKSLDLNKKRCGFCHGVFELLINKNTKSEKIKKKSTFQTKQLSGFALYVKENYQSVKQSRIAIKHGEVMKILSKQFSAIKITQKSKEHINET
ncbi:PREDICTED: uncharacterized protein LOC105365823 [Ceratosolen solmsi marchali]|uniref:Uncharacterized protein LOC105365823 n=1 Tax=Ceratosolen solmsi marchali TaxID=326594 RepID=A0AAJ6YQJ3_9HYME|nr:PREDICTED: uncharacterized protein LOC105365823 [Ceratosolen solmsi marchali]